MITGANGAGKSTLLAVLAVAGNVDAGRLLAANHLADRRPQPRLEGRFVDGLTGLPNRARWEEAAACRPGPWVPAAGLAASSGSRSARVIAVTTSSATGVLAA